MCDLFVYTAIMLEYLYWYKDIKKLGYKDTISLYE